MSLFLVNSRRYVSSSTRVLLAFSVWMVAAQAGAQGVTTDDATRAAARQLGVEGIAAYQANDFASADQKLERAYRLYPAPTLGLYSARARAKLGRLVEAAERYRQATRSAPNGGESGAQQEAQQEASKELDALVPRIPTLTVVLEGAHAAQVSVTLDDAPYSNDLIGVARPTNPGAHRVLARLGSEQTEQALTLGENEHKTVTLTLHAPAALQPTATPAAAAATLQLSSDATTQRSLWRPVSITALSLGAVGLITWGVSSLIADGKLDKCKERNGEHWCATEELAAPYNTARTIAAVSFWTGAVLSVGGASMLIWDSHERATESPSVSWGISPGGASLRGVF